MMNTREIRCLRVVAKFGPEGANVWRSPEHGQLERQGYITIDNGNYVTITGEGLDALSSLGCDRVRFRGINQRGDTVVYTFTKHPMMNGEFCYKRNGRTYHRRRNELRAYGRPDHNSWTVLLKNIEEPA